MVAYSFNRRFAQAIVDWRKTHTIRAARGPKGRHARPGERVQLYVGMRTKYCQKLLDPDPVCVGVDAIMILMDETEILAICINNIYLHTQELHAFARSDGFKDLKDMHAFWLKEHGARNFNGVIIKWQKA